MFFIKLLSISLVLYSINFPLSARNMNQTSLNWLFDFGYESMGYRSYYMRTWHKKWLQPTEFIIPWLHVLYWISVQICSAV